MRNFTGTEGLISATTVAPADTAEIQLKMANDLLMMLTGNASTACSLIIGYTPDGGEQKFSEMLMMASSAQNIAAHIAGCVSALISITQGVDEKTSLEEIKTFFQKNYGFKHRGVEEFNKGNAN